MIWLPDATVDHLIAVAGWPEFTSDRYEVIEEIGRGGMGTVYSARDHALGREVAIKIGNALPSAELQARLTSEAKVLARLEHPGIVPVHDFGILADGRPFYVMKRVHGRTLQACIESGLPLADRLRIFERVCEAVSFAHAHGILHRDLKPDNVMVGTFGEVMVMDWGVARVPDEAPDAEGTRMGTPGFMAPEQAGHAGRADERADVYALGAILSMLVTGDAPQPDAVLTVQHLNRASGVAPPLRSICRCALAPASEDRYPTVARLADDVARFREDHAVSVHREGPVERARRFVRTYEMPILLVLAYILMRAVIAVLARI